MCQWKCRSHFHIKETYVTPEGCENSVIYKDFEGTLSTTNESHSSIWQDKKVLFLPFALFQRNVDKKVQCPCLIKDSTFPSCHHTTSTDKHKQIIMLRRRMHERAQSRAKSNILSLQNFHCLHAYFQTSPSWKAVFFSHPEKIKSQIKLKCKHI